MGQVDKDFQISPERSNEYPGRLAVRLSIGCGVRKFHTASAELRRADVVNLWRCQRGRAAIPDAIAVWWRQQDEEDRRELMAMLRDLSWISWVALWWEAGR